VKGERPGQKRVRAGGFEPPWVAPPGPKLHMRRAGRCSGGLYQTFKLGRRRSVISSCTRSSRGVAARPVSNLVSIGAPVLRDQAPIGRPARQGRLALMAPMSAATSVGMLSTCLKARLRCRRFHLSTVSTTADGVGGVAVLQTQGNTSIRRLI
jgi:hypothetical protein